MTERKKAPNTFMEVVEPIVNRCKVAHALNKNVEFNPIGAEALGGLLVSMAQRLDRTLMHKSVLDMTDEEFAEYTKAEQERRGLTT